MKKLISMTVTFVFTVSLLSAGSAFAYTDEEINEAISELNSQIKSLKEGGDKSATVAGRAYIAYESSHMKDSRFNEFAIHRVYLDFKKKLDKNVDARFTLDVDRFEPLTSASYDPGPPVGVSTKSDERLIAYLKYAYFGLNNLDVPYTGLSTVRLGQQATHWIDFMQNHWKFRYVQKTMTDYFKVFSSADLGLGALGGFDLSSLMIPYIGRFDYHATLMNGEGYKKPEGDANGDKHLAVTIKTEPVRWGKSDVVTSAIGWYVEDYPIKKDQNPASRDLTNALTAMTSYAFTKPGKGLVFVEGYLGNMVPAAPADKTTLASGVSIGGQYQLIPDVNAFGRFDNFDPDASFANMDKKLLTVFGVEYNWGANVKLALDWQNEQKDGVDQKKSINVHTRVKW